MTLDWTVRVCVEGDAHALSIVGSATFLETFAGIIDGPDVIAHCLHQHAPAIYAGWIERGASLWVAEAPGAAPVGYAVLAEPDLPLSDIGSDDIELKRLYALSRFHGSGLGGALMAAAVDAAIEMGRKRLLLGVHAQNERAIRFYRKQGFELAGERRFRVGGSTFEDVILARKLG